MNSQVSVCLIEQSQTELKEDIKIFQRSVPIHTYDDVDDDNNDIGKTIL